MSFSWLPAMLAAHGLGLAAASRGLAAYNYGGVAGVVCFVSLVNRFGSRILTLVSASLAVVTALLLIRVEIGPAANSLFLLAALAAHGFCVNAVQTSLFALGVHLYPTRVRSTGVAVGAAVGRAGGIVSALTGSFVIQLGRAEFFEFLAACMFVALIGLRRAAQSYSEGGGHQSPNDAMTASGGCVLRSLRPRVACPVPCRHWI